MSQSLLHPNFLQCSLHNEWLLFPYCLLQNLNRIFSRCTTLGRSPHSNYYYCASDRCTCTPLASSSVDPSNIQRSSRVTLQGIIQLPNKSISLAYTQPSSLGLQNHRLTSHLSLSWSVFVMKFPPVLRCVAPTRLLITSHTIPIQLGIPELQSSYQQFITTSSSHSDHHVGIYWRNLQTLNIPPLGITLQLAIFSANWVSYSRARRVIYQQPLKRKQ